MTITPDSSSPPIEAGFTNPLTSGSFSPPSGSTLVACVVARNSGDIITMSNSGTPLTWIERRRFNRVAIYTAYNETAQSNITVSFATSGSFGDILVSKVIVWNGVDSTNPVASFGNGGSTTSFITPSLYTSTVDNSRGVYIANDANGTGPPEAGGPDVRFDYTSGGAPASGIVAYKSSNTTPSGTNVTAWLDGYGTAAVNWTWVGVELRPSTTQTITLTGISSGEAVGTPQLNQTITLTGIGTSESLGTPAIALQNRIILEGIPSLEAVGTPSLVYGQNVSPTGITSGETFGTLSVQLGYPQTVIPEGIASEESVGQGPSVKLTSRMVFRPPSVQEQPMARNRLHIRYGIHRGISVIKRTDGTFYETRYPDQVTVEESAKVYWGGHVNEITVEDALALTTAGYGSYITTEVIT